MSQETANVLDMIRTGTKRKLLIVEDNELNREILSEIVSAEFDVLTAENGAEGIDVLTAHYRELSLILLDVNMPVMNGFEFLERVHSDALLANVPIIVTTASESPADEVRCLQLGASDFVTKPYNPDVVMGRVHSIIKLKESVATLSAVEFDDLSGLYTMQAFYHHAETLLKADEQAYHVMVADLHEFKLLNSVFGQKTGDMVIRYLGGKYRELMPDTLCARDGARFYFLVAKRADYSDERHQKVHDNIISNAPVPNLGIRYGVYLYADKNEPVSILCDRALMALSSLNRNLRYGVGFYNDEIRNRMLNDQHMEMEFPGALKRGEFRAWFQPKYDTNSERIVGAEALVRWFTSDGKMISPGEFIPLFERDGFIAGLDEYIFRGVCAFQAQRIAENKSIVPISVNLSRSSLYQADIVRRYTAIARETGIPGGLVPLELTESAATEDGNVRELTAQLKAAGFDISMDDFGTGYSSLSSLTSMPFDVIKLDKSLIDKIGTDKGNTIVHHIINIAREMGMKVVAEGVETAEQVNFLRSAECDMIQGYYYAPPQSAETFEKLLDEQKKTEGFDLNAEYAKIDAGRLTEFKVDRNTVDVLRSVMDEMAEGFFVYRAASDETVLYANPAMIRLMGCADKQEFDKFTENCYRNTVAPAEYERVERSVFRQLSDRSDGKDFVDYHIVRRDGRELFVRRRGYCVHTAFYGNVFYVFLSESI